MASASPGTLGNYERDEAQQPDAYLLARVARVLGVTLDWLVMGKGNPDGAPIPELDPAAVEEMRRLREEVEEFQRRFLKRLP